MFACEAIGAVQFAQPAFPEGGLEEENDVHARIVLQMKPKCQMPPGSRDVGDVAGMPFFASQWRRILRFLLRTEISLTARGGVCYPLPSAGTASVETVSLVRRRVAGATRLEQEIDWKRRTGHGEEMDV